MRYAVVIPSRGRREMLLTALESVYAQTLPPDQVVVVLDGDTDSSAAAVRDAFPDTTLIIHETSLGPARSRQDGFKAVTTEWVCLLDDDDIWHSRKQEHFAEYLREHPSCAALRSAFWQFSELGAATELNGFKSEISGLARRPELERAARLAVPLNDFTYLQIRGKSLPALLRKNAGVTSSTMFRRELLTLVEDIPDDLRTGQDWLLFVYIAVHVEWHLVPGRWFFYRVHAGQITTDSSFPKWQHRLRAWSLAWQNAGRPAGLRIADYADEYAGEVHRWFWEAVRQGRMRESVHIFTGGSAFVESRLLRLSILMPPPVRWRMRPFLNRLREDS
nr:glycosyltransferase family 2 protein [Ornithinimicrobium sediminis]